MNFNWLGDTRMTCTILPSQGKVMHAIGLAKPLGRLCHGALAPGMLTEALCSSKDDYSPTETDMINQLPRKVDVLIGFNCCLSPLPSQGV
jgi:hypothetical protein